MRIKSVAYDFYSSNFEIVLPEHDPLTFVVSNSETKRNGFITAIELAWFKISDEPCPITKSLVHLENGNEYEYPVGRFDREGPLGFDHEQFRSYIQGKYCVDIIKCLSDESYKKQVDGFLSRLSGGAFKSIKWDSKMGLVIGLGNGKSRSVFMMSAGELALINFSGRLTELSTLYKFQIFTSNPIKLLDPDNAARFYVEFFGTLKSGIQVIFVCSLMDLLGTPLSMLKDARVIDLDKSDHAPEEA
jgi:hypothetical protein